MNRLDYVGTAVILALGLFSLVLMESGHSSVESELTRSLASVDNLTRARVHATRGYRMEGLRRAGNPTVSRSAAESELQAAQTLLDDWMLGRSSLLGMDAIPPADPEQLAQARALSHALQALHRTVLQEEGLDPFALRLAFAEVERSAGELERSVHDRVRSRMAEESRRHLIRLALWSLFILASALGFMALRRNEARARRQWDRATQQRDRARERYASLLEISPAGFLRCLPDGRIMEASPWWHGEMEDPEGTPWYGRHWWDGFPTESRRVAEERWSIRTRIRRAFSLELMRAGPDGDTRWYLLKWTPKPGPGKEMDWLGAVLDVTERREMEVQLHHAQRLEAVGQFTGGIAHDFNNLLSVVMANAHLLEEELPEDGEAREFLQDIQAAGESGRTLVRGLMGFSRQAPLQVRDLALMPAVSESVRLAQRLLPSGVDLTVEGSPRSPVVHGDPHAIQQILLNLISNARDAMPHGGSIQVTVGDAELDDEYLAEHPWFEAGRYGLIAVADTGAGMDQATADRVFDPFFTTKPRGKGTGLGLATAHGLVRQMGGQIHVYSEPGVGSVFRIYLPLVEEGQGARSDAEGHRSRPPAEAGSRSGATLLVVDDDPVLRRAATRTLERLGYEVLAAADGVEALAILDDRPVELIISDVAMPGMGGIELFHALSAREWEGSFLFSSGYSRADLAGREEVPGQAGFLPKPWTVAQIRDAVARSLAASS